MAVAKVILNGVTQMDLTSDTVGSSTALSGYTGHGADGEAFQGIVNVSGGGGGTHTATYLLPLGGYAASQNYVLSPDSVKLYRDGETFSFTSGQQIDIVLSYYSGYDKTNRICENSIVLAQMTSGSVSYRYTLPDCDVQIVHGTPHAAIGTFTSTGRTITNIITDKALNDKNAIIQRNGFVSYEDSGVRLIGEYAFATNYYINDVYFYSFPNVSIISRCAFMYNNYIRSIYAPNTEYIGANAFRSCYLLGTNSATVDFPKVSFVDANAFTATSHLYSINFGSSFVSFSSGGYQFSGAEVLEYVSMHYRGSFIPTFAFASCKLHNLDFLSDWDYSYPEAAYQFEIASHAFRACKYLESVVISAGGPKQGLIDGMELIIGSYAFSGCTSVSIVSIPYVRVTDVGAFSSCSNLKEVYMPRCSYLGQSTFANCSLLEKVELLTDSTTTYVSSYSTVIGSQAFINCYSLSSFVAPYFNSINNTAFKGCSALETIDIACLRNMENGAFSECINLKTVIIGYGASYSYGGTISASAFYKCYNLLSLYILYPHRQLTLGNANVFTSTPISTYTTSTGGINGSIFVPESLYSSYIASTNWATYSARFVSLTDAQISNVLQYGTHEPT